MYLFTNRFKHPNIDEFCPRVWREFTKEQTAFIFLAGTVENGKGSGIFEIGT